MILLLICMLNFLIAIISDTYVNVTANQINNIYIYRSILNLEYTQIRSESIFKDKFSMIIMVCPVKAEDRSKTDKSLHSMSAIFQELF